MRPLKVHLLNPKTNLPACMKKYEGWGYVAVRLGEFRQKMGDGQVLCGRCLRFLAIAEKKIA